MTHCRSAPLGLAEAKGRDNEKARGAQGLGDWPMGIDLGDIGNKPGKESARIVLQPIPAFAEIRGYWEALRKSDALPFRADLDPRGLKNCLHQTLIAEQVAPGLARLRLAGAVFTDVMGMEVRGMPVSALFDPMARPALETVISRVFAGNVTATLLLEAERGLGRPALTAQLLLLPMLGETAKVELMLGCLVLRGTAGRTPRRFQIQHAKYEAIGAAPLAPYVPLRNFSDAPAAYEAPARKTFAHTETGVPYLRVVK